jgi:hypothetical protein
MTYSNFKRAFDGGLRSAGSLGALGALLLAHGHAFAQAAGTTPPPPPAPATDAPVATSVPVPAPEPAAPTTASESMPSTATEEKLPPINVAAWLRIGARVQGTTEPKKLNDQSMDSVYGELHAGGKIHKNVSVTLNLNANGLAGTAGIEDAIVGFDFMDPLHLWVGQLLVPVDRANYGGPFFMIPWNYPGFLTVGGTTTVMAPHEGPNGRNAGAVVWGDFAGGAYKYLVGAFDNGSGTTSPLFSARLSADFIGKEPGFFGNATYFGQQDILALAVGGQYQKKGSVGQAIPAMGMAPAVPAPTDNYAEFNADALAEFKLGDSGGWVTGDAAYYHFAGDYEGIHDAFYILAAVASPKVGIGNIQPMLRYQMAKGDGGTKVSAIDAAVGYLMMGPALRTSLGFQHTDLGNSRVGNALQLDVQAIFF